MQELRKRELLDEQEAILTQLSEEVPVSLALAMMGPLLTIPSHYRSSK